MVPVTIGNGGCEHERTEGWHIWHIPPIDCCSFILISFIVFFLIFLPQIILYLTWTVKEKWPHCRKNIKMIFQTGHCKIFKRAVSCLRANVWSTTSSLLRCEPKIYYVVPKLIFLVSNFLKHVKKRSSNTLKTFWITLIVSPNERYDTKIHWNTIENCRNDWL